MHAQSEYLQFDLDGQDINGAKQEAGKVVGAFRVTEPAPRADALQPYETVFGLKVRGGGFLLSRQSLACRRCCPLEALFLSC